MKTIKLRKLALAVVVVLILVGLTACEGILVEEEKPSKPMVVIISPPLGTRVKVGEEVAVQSTATDAKGVIRVELWVDGSLYRIDASPAPQGQPSLPVVQRWTPATAGSHTLEVRAYNVDGLGSDPAAITVEVVEAVAVATPTPTLPIDTPPPATDTPPPPATDTPLPPATDTPPPPLATPTATVSNLPRIVYLRANGEEESITVEAGTTVTLSWEWERTAEGYLDPGNIGMACPGIPCTYQVTPGASTTYTLRAYNAAGSDQRSVTVNVTGAPPPPPPPPPEPEPEEECEPGDTKVADDGCNTCWCMADGTWACTMMLCPP